MVKELKKIDRETSNSLLPKIYVIYFREDDPRKNTSLKMVRKGLAKLVDKRYRYSIPRKAIILNPFAKEVLTPRDRKYIIKYGIVVVDASWKKLSPRYFRSIRGLHRKLPFLIAGNPVNYGKPYMLSSIEAVTAALYITGFDEVVEKLIGLYKWMNTFITLNKELLNEYRGNRG